MPHKDIGVITGKVVAITASMIGLIILAIGLVFFGRHAALNSTPASYRIAVLPFVNMSNDLNQRAALNVLAFSFSLQQLFSSK